MIEYFYYEHEHYQLFYARERGNKITYMKQPY